MIWTVYLKERPFNDILNNKKTIEGRLNKGIFSEMKINDSIIFINKQKKINVKIANIRNFESFEKMLIELPFENILPSINNFKEGVELYNSLYNENKIKKYGVVALLIKLNLC